MQKRIVVGTALGSVEEESGRKRLKLRSPQHWQAVVNRLVVGKEYAITVERLQQSRSQQQVAYHFVLMGYLADFSGHSKEEMHDFVVTAKFGTKRIALGDQVENVRRSLSQVAAMSVDEVNELIEYDLELCHNNGVVVPTKEELGYL